VQACDPSQHDEYEHRSRRIDTQHELAEWHQRIRAQDWKETFVFFKHEDEGTGPKLAAQFLKLAGK